MKLSNYFIQPNMHILFGITCCLIFGIISGKVIENTYAIWSIYFFAFLGTGLFLISTKIKIHLPSKNITTSICILSISLVAGNLLYKKQQQAFLDFYNQYQNKTCSISGTITDIEYMAKYQRIKECITLNITSIKIADTEITNTQITKQGPEKLNIQKKAGNIHIQIYSPFKTSCKVSDAIELNNVTIKKPNNESFFSYLIKKNINTSVFLTQNNIIIKKRPNYSLMRWICDTKYLILERIRTKMPQQSFVLFSSLFLGNKTLVKNSLQPFAQQFRQWGISHYLARSGLHLTIFTFIWLILFRFFPFSFFFKQICMLILCSVYLIFSWSSISFLRAFYSFFLYTLCNIFKIPIHFLHILTLVTLYVIICNPIQIFFLDFQLSFALTFALALIANLYSINKTNLQKY